MVGANIIYDAGGTVSIAHDPTDVFNRPYYNYANPLSGRFLIYRVYWDATAMRFTVVDGGIERDLYTTPYALGPQADEMREPFYLLANLAIGGAFTDCYRLGDPGSGLPISMPLPATMYLDYVRVYQWNGQGQVTFGPPTAQNGRFGLYTDNTPTNGGLVTGVTSTSTGESTLVNGTIPRRRRQRHHLADERPGLVRRGHHVAPADQPVQHGHRQPQVPDQDPRQRHVQDRRHRCVGQPVLCPVPRQPDPLRPGAQRRLGRGRRSRWPICAAPPSTCAC